MKNEWCEAEKEVYGKVAEMRKNLRPLQVFNMRHAGARIRMQALLDAGWQEWRRSDVPHGHVSVLKKNSMRLELGLGENGVTFFRWLDIVEECEREEFPVAREDCLRAGIGEALLLREDMAMLWNHPDGYREDLTEDERCFCEILSQLFNMKMEPYASTCRLLSPYVRAILTGDDPEGREILANITQLSLFTDCLVFIALARWKEGAVAFLAQVMMLFYDEISSGTLDYRKWKSLFRAAVMCGCWQLAACAAERCAGTLDTEGKDARESGLTPERYMMIAAISRLKGECEKVENMANSTDEDWKQSQAAYVVAMEAIAKSFAREEERFDRENPDFICCAPGAKVPLEWQAYFLLHEGADPEIVLQNFPKAALNGDWPNRARPLILQKHGESTQFVLEGLFPREESHVTRDRIEKLIGECTVPHREFSTRKRVIPAISSRRHEMKAMETFNPPDRRSHDIEPLAVRGIREDEHGREVSEQLNGFVEWSPALRKTLLPMAVRLWEINPWHVAELGEGRFELANGVHVHAIMPYFQNDSISITRGVRMKAMVMMIGQTLARDLPEKILDGSDGKVRMGPEFSCLIQDDHVPDFVSEARSSFRAKVVSVRDVTMRGGVTVTCFRLHFQSNVLPVDMDCCIHRTRIDGEMPQVGDVVQGGGWLCVDPYEFEESSASFFARNPWGLPVPCEIPPGCMDAAPSPS